MKRLFCFLLSASLLCSQAVKLEPGLAVAEAEYRDAEDAWLHDDPRLEADLLKGDPKEMRRRIEKAAALRDRVMQKKAVYLEAMVGRVGDLRKKFLASPPLANVPAEEMKKDLEHERNLLLDQQERLESRMRELPEGDEFSLVRRSMEAEKNDLIALQNDVAKRIGALSTVGKAQQEAALLSSSEDLRQRVDELERIWQEERNKTIRARAAWANYYLDLERAVEDKDRRKPKQSKRPVSELELPALSEVSPKPPETAAARPDARLDEFAEAPPQSGAARTGS